MDFVVVPTWSATRPASPGNLFSARRGNLQRVVSHFQSARSLDALWSCFSFLGQSAFPPQGRLNAGARERSIWWMLRGIRHLGELLLFVAITSAFYFPIFLFSRITHSFCSAKCHPLARLTLRCGVPPPMYWKYTQLYQQNVFAGRSTLNRSMCRTCYCFEES